MQKISEIQTLILQIVKKDVYNKTRKQFVIDYRIQYI